MSSSCRGPVACLYCEK